MSICIRKKHSDASLSREEELISVLDDISAVSKQLAAKLTMLSQKEWENQEGGKPYEQNGRTCRCRF